MSSNPLDEIVMNPQKESKSYLSQQEVREILEHLFYFSPYLLYRLFWLMYWTLLSRKELCEILLGGR
ncbi:MAG: hypothetical protein HN353_10375 [Bdellovibrionales bacterium]|jgi:hypothetical protein|nr:hypothetical protein [Bdellovibrionales bacterium]MBT3524820.1 hypothetical protein [Bdellovibrionales bacterium]MBT7668968.1 hypothetical protein [Bdellovibrionales bacterium]MBT7767486.1 hypothetical protein [Bdellovibrionales bacterium]